MNRRSVALLASAAVAVMSPASSSWAAPCTTPALDDRCEAWVGLHDASAYGGEQARGVAVGGGRVFVTGLTHQAELEYDFRTVAYDATTGAEVWSAQYNGGFDGESVDIAWDVAAAPDGSVAFVTGEVVSGFETGYDAVTLAYDGATGDVLWERAYHLSSVDRGIAVEVDEELVYTMVQVGATQERANDALVVVAYDARTGERRWESLVEGLGTLWPAGLALAGGRAYVAGWTQGTDTVDDTDFLVAAFAAGPQGGTRLWVASHDGGQGGSEDRATDLAVSPDGSRVYVTGYVDRVSALFATYQIATVAFDGASGGKLWSTTYGGATGGGQGAAIVASPDGTRVFVAGKTTGSPTADGLQTTFQFVTLAYDAGSGTQSWVQGYDHPGTTDHPTTMAISPDGRRLYVSGWSAPYAYPEAGMDAVTVAYDLQTETRWVARYNSHTEGLDGVRPWTSVATNERVFVIGGTRRFEPTRPLTGQYDFATLAYAA